MDGEIDRLNKELSRFRRDREWGKYHTAKNLAISVTVEAAELLEHFQWLDTGEELSPGRKEEVEREIADVFIYLIMLSNELEVDLIQATWEKIEENAMKYPVDKSRGSSKKYNEV